MRNFFILILLSALLGACQNKDIELEQIESNEESIAKEQESYDSLAVFNLSAKDIYIYFDETTYLAGNLNINKEKNHTTFTGEHKAFYLSVQNLRDDKIDQIYTQILKTNFLEEPKIFEEIIGGYKSVFETLDVPYNEEKLIDILKTDVTKDRENKIDSSYEDMFAFEYGPVWITIEGIYHSNNEPKPNYYEVRITPENLLES